MRWQIKQTAGREGIEPVEPKKNKNKNKNQIYTPGIKIPSPMKSAHKKVGIWYGSLRMASPPVPGKFLGIASRSTS